MRSGHYNNASEVIRDALRGLIRREEQHQADIATLRAEIEEGINSPVSPYTFEDIIEQEKVRFLEND